jgi:hypothetical protein
MTALAIAACTPLPALAAPLKMSPTKLGILKMA